MKRRNKKNINSLNAMICLSLELTRRCNMNCSFCSKGEPQSIDITKDIIDKTFDEIREKNVFLRDLRFGGGEPFLMPDMIDYVIDEIIRRKIFVNNLVVFTNGAIHNPKIFEAFRRFVEYRYSVDSKIKEILNAVDDEMFGGLEITTNYPNAGEYVCVIVSSNFHSLTDKERNEAVTYYQEAASNKYIHVINQSDVFKDGDLNSITLSGNVEKNYKSLIGETTTLNKIRCIDNKYDFITPCIHDKKKFHIGKTISISANGNVFAGCSMSYEDVDAEPMFNITECNGDFVERIVKWCRSYPVNIKTKQFREMRKSILWCQNHNISIKNIDEAQMNIFNQVYFMSQIQETTAIEIQSVYPNLYDFEVDFLAMAVIVLKMFMEDIHVEFIKSYLKSCSHMDEADIERITPEMAKNFIRHITELDKKRNLGNLRYTSPNMPVGNFYKQ